MDPLVSVIIPTYNRASYVVQAVQSVLDQTYENIEVIVVDDGSTDNTKMALRKYEGQITYIHQQRSERSIARNHGFRQSSGEFIAFLDSDDSWLPMKVEKQVEVLSSNPNVGLVYVDIQFIDANGDPYNGEVSWDVPDRTVLYEDLMTHNVITGTTSSVMVRRKCLEKVGLFDESMNTCEDLDLYRRIARHFKFHKVDLPLVQFRLHKGSTQHDAAAMAKGWEITIRKIAEDTPAQFTYYKNQAIAKNLVQIAHLYASGRQPHRVFSFCVRAVFHRPNWILRYGFWRDLVRLAAERTF